MTIDVPVESPQGNILNYSIISSSDDEENPLKLKLKISKSSNKVPQVILQKLDDEYVASLSLKPSIRAKNFNEFEMKEVEKSSINDTPSSTPRKRARPRKNEVFNNVMHSPTKIQKTPVKKNELEKHLDNLCTTMVNKVNVTTPVKRSLAKSNLNDSDYEMSDSPSKKGILNSTSVVETPRRRDSRLANPSPMKVDENLILSGKRLSRTPVRFTEDTSTHSAKINLNESFRRIVLRSRHNVENISKSERTRNSSIGLRRSTRKSYAEFYTDLEDAEAIQVAEALKESKIEVDKHQRVVRSRGNSISSNLSEATSSDSEGISTRVLRSRGNSLSSISSQKSPERIPSQQVAPKTPKSRQQINKAKTPKSAATTPKTPKNRLKMLREGVITPSMHSRSSTICGDSTPLMRARTQLHVSYVPTSLPCREKEYLDVYNFLRAKLDDGCGGCMYISGVPGTGKTATVTSVIDSLVKDKKVPKFSYVSINGMRLTEPRQAYVEIWKQLTTKTVPWEHAQSLLEERFTKKKNHSPVVILIDELDILCTKRQDVVYNLLDWPTKCKDQLVVITIANTMDLPERLLMSRVTSRLGLTRLTFQAYTHKQLMEIVTKRLTGTDSFNSDAVQLVARKVASVSGDARRALDICRRAAEIAESDGKTQLVSIMHINEALTAMITQPQVMAMKRCSRLQKLLLQAIVAEIERTGVEETTFSDIFKMLISCCALDGFKMVSSTVAQRAIAELSAAKLILTDQKCGDIFQRVILNVSVHDVYFALKKE
ncbi:origin recognition complex subunit 1 [Anthonomus grandis grandis]|uniref:origin recognition complex subunit 1 n=1 Tax=Anthonomus grandis grandis TaxID=2921223 RepID=UPI0021655B3C|nr:origin recognition complex subunit 1 [Anthonomus grandis grandis]